MTSNLGARARSIVRFGEVGAGELALESDRAVREFFPPELFNRIDRVVHFQPLTPESAELIVEKELGKLLARRGLTARNIFVSVTDAVRERIVREAFDPRYGARPLKRYLEEQVGTLLAEQIVSGPPSPMQFFQVYERDGRLGLTAEALVPRDPVEASWALEPMLAMGPAELIEQLELVRQSFDQGEQRAAVERISEEIRAQLAVHNQGKQENAERLYHLDALRLHLEELGQRLAAYTDRPDVEARERLQDAGYREFHTPYQGTERVRLFDRRSLAPKKAVTREELLETLAEAFFLRRALTRVDDPSQHAVYLEIVQVGKARREDRLATGSSLITWLAQAYFTARGTVEGVAGRLPDGVIFESKTWPLSNLSKGFEQLVLRISGVCVKDFFEGEEGSHVWVSLGRLPEIARVRVLPLSAGESARQVIEAHLARVAAFNAARPDAAGRLPADPELPLPVVRQYRFEPSLRPGELSDLSVEDYLLPYSMDLKAFGLTEALPQIWRLRMSRVDR